MGNQFLIFIIWTNESHSLDLQFIGVFPTSSLQDFEKKKYIYTYSYLTVLLIG